MNNGGKERLDVEDLKGALSSITAQMWGVERHKESTYDWKRRLMAFRAGRIVASLRILFPEQYQDKDGNLAEYIESQLGEFQGVKTMLSYTLGQFVGRLFPHKKNYPATRYPLRSLVIYVLGRTTGRIGA